ncbi:uncharacterized protein [Amphiura filiformis]|uniref:uncharacterized protein isoform X2 n=1 Tax=Amphiura filiformis TaxID=82378 RepID=UPI003B228A50
MGRTVCSYGITILPLCIVAIIVKIAVKEVLGQDGLDVCDYLNLNVVETFANGNLDTYFHLAPAPGTDIYFLLTPSVLSYVEEDRITVTLEPFNLGDVSSITLVIQAFDSNTGIAGTPIGIWTAEQGGMTTTCGSGRNTIFHLSFVSTAQSYQYIASNVQGRNIFFRATIKVSQGTVDNIYFGIQSERVVPAMGVSPCNPDPCANGGTCTSDNGLSYVCACPPGWGGNTCTTAWLSPCTPNPCSNGGTCAASTVSSSGFHCLCQTGYDGITCHTWLSPCNSNPCSNGGTCAASTVSSSGFHCLCQTGYDGITCQTPTAPQTSCSSNTCNNDGTCVSTATGHHCFCTGRFEGQHCEIDKSLPCQPDPCQNGGQCFVSPDLTYSICQCVPPWTGQVCNMTTGIGSTTEMDIPVKGNTSRNIAIGASTGAAIFVIIIVVIIGLLYWRKQHKPESNAEDVYYNTHIVPGTLRPGVYTGNRGSRHEGQGMHIDNICYQDAMDIMQTYHNKEYEEIPATVNDDTS